LHNFASGSNLSPTNGNSVGNISSGNAASFTDLSLSHLTSWNQNPDLTQVANTTAPSITLSAAVQAASTGMTHPIPQLSISNASTPPPSTSPIVKTEPLSPRDLQHHSGLPNVQSQQQLHHQLHQLQRPQSANSVLSPHLSPNHVASGHATPTPHGSHQRLAISPNPMQAAHAQVSAHQLTLGHVGNDYDPSVPLQKRFRGPENSHAHSSSEPGHHWTSS